MRLYWPKKICLFISSKSKAKLKARRTRASLNLSRRILKAKACMTAEIADREFFQHHALVAHGREIVGRRPVLGAVLGAPIDLIALECLQRHRGIAEIFVADCLEISRADDDVEILAPVVVHFFVDQRCGRARIPSAGRAAAERRLQRGLRDVALLARSGRCLPTNASAAPAAGRRSAAVRGCPARRR